MLHLLGVEMVELFTVACSIFFPNMLFSHVCTMLQKPTSGGPISLPCLNNGSHSLSQSRLLLLPKRSLRVKIKVQKTLAISIGN